MTEPLDIFEGDILEEEILKVEIECVTPPSAEQLESLRRIVSEKYGVPTEKVRFIVKKDPSVVGGFRMYIGDDNYDWTTLGRIRQLRKSFQRLSRESDGEKIISLLREDIRDFELHTGHQQVGTVISVGDGIAMIDRLYDVEYGEIVLFDCGVKGMVLDIRADKTSGVVLFGDESEICEGSRVVRTRRSAGIPISTKILGRMIDPLGAPIDGLGEIGAKEYYPIEYPAPAIIDRGAVSRPLETGILAIDSMFPVGRGQRELIIGDRRTGKTSIALDTIVNQKGKKVVCVYVAIGQKGSSISKVVSTLEAAGALDYTVIVSSPASDTPALQYIAPYAGCAVAEYFMKRGRDVLIVYDDLSKHAVAYRTISLLLERSPGREAYPGDVFYLHSRLLERAAQLSDEHGGGSMTALPIVETKSGDLSAYIPTNIISITDGQIFLESELFFAGQRPAVNVGLSVSRVGGAAQTKLMKGAVGSLRLELAQYREMQVFSQFGGELDAATAKELRYGSGLMQLLRQQNGHPMPREEQVVLLITARAGLFTDVPRDRIIDVRDGMLEHFARNCRPLMLELRHGADYTSGLAEKIVADAKRYIDSVV